METAGRDEGQVATPGLGPAQRTGVRLTLGGPPRTPLPHQGFGWGVLGAPGFLELWRKREGGDSRLMGARARKTEGERMEEVVREKEGEEEVKQEGGR